MRDAAVEIAGPAHTPLPPAAVAGTSPEIR